MWRFGEGLGNKDPSRAAAQERRWQGRGPETVFDQTILPNCLQKTSPGETVCPSEKSLLLKMSGLFTYRADDKSSSLQ